MYFTSENLITKFKKSPWGIVNKYTLVVILGAVLFAGRVFGFTEPTLAPPQDNVPAPLNVGPNGQAKEGGLSLNSSGAPNGLLVEKGNVGIGTTIPLHKFEIVDSLPVLALRQKGGKAYYMGLNGPVDTPSLDFYTDDLTSLFLTYDGNVGIGTTNPGQLLDVIGGYIRSNIGFCIGGDCINTWPAGGGGLPLGSSGDTLRYDGSDWIANNIIYNNGTKVGIGTITPDFRSSVKLDMGNNIIAGVTTPTAGTDAANKNYVDARVAGGGPGSWSCTLVQGSLSYGSTAMCPATHRLIAGGCTGDNGSNASSSGTHPTNNGWACGASGMVIAFAWCCQ